MARPTDSNEQLLCSFCGKSQRQVKKLIAGPEADFESRWRGSARVPRWTPIRGPFDPQTSNCHAARSFELARRR